MRSKFSLLSKTSASVLSLCIFLFVSVSQAQSVTKVKGQAVLIDSGGLQMNVGDEFYTISESGKKTAIIKISKVKDNKAIAQITRGVAVPGETLTVRTAPQTSAADADSSSDASAVTTRKQKKYKNSWGLLLGYSMDSLTFLAANNAGTYTENASMTGNSFKFKGFFDHAMSDSFNYRLFAGYDGFNGNYSAQSNTINNNASSTSTLSVSFLTLEGEVMWNMYKKSLTSVWLGLGYSFQYVMSLSTNVYSLQLNSSYLNSYYAGIGSNIKMSATTYLPIYLHYNMFPANSGVTQSAINLGLGWGWAF